MNIDVAILDSARAARGKSTDVRPIGAELYYLPVTTRMPLKFGLETLTSVTCARVKLTVSGRDGRRANGWGETPLSVEWSWPGKLSHESRRDAMSAFCEQVAVTWASLDVWGHPLEVGNYFQHVVLPRVLKEFNRDRQAGEQMPYLAALVCASAFDIALHDAFGVLHGMPTYATYNHEYMNCDLATLYAEAEPRETDFAGKYPSDYLLRERKNSLPVWHLVGGLDPLDKGDLNGNEPNDGYPVTLIDWIERDGLKCLKVKLRGNDAEWDYQRLARVGRIAHDCGAPWLTADFNCTVGEPAYVNHVLDQLRRDEPATHDAILYVKQPFPYDLNQFPIDVHSVASRKPLFLDESAHDWLHVKRGRALGWTGVALKTCKTQTGAILSLCWAQAHGMQLMVQDLSNPMLAQIPHLLLAAHANTIMGVESNAMQFYPEASTYEARVHPGLYQRRGGELDLSSVRGAGFGYRLDEINRSLPPAALRCGE